MESEEEAYAAKQRLGIAVRSEVFAIEVLNSRVDVRERNVACTDFPALCTDDLGIFRAEDRRVGAEVTVRGISTPSVLVLRLSALVAVDCLPRFVEVIGARVVGISREQTARIVEVLADICRPDVGVIFVVLAVRVAFSIVEAIRQTDEVVRVEVIISGTARPLAGRRCVLERDALHVSSIIEVTITEVITLFLIGDINAACIDRRLERVAERHIGTGHRVIRIEDEALLRRVETKFTELRLEVLVVALCIDTLECDFIFVMVVAVTFIVGHLRRSIKAGIDMPVIVDFSARLET